MMRNEFKKRLYYFLASPILRGKNLVWGGQFAKIVRILSCGQFCGVIGVGNGDSNLFEKMGSLSRVQPWGFAGKNRDSSSQKRLKNWSQFCEIAVRKPIKSVKRAKKMRLLPLVQVIDFIEESSKQASHFLLHWCKIRSVYG